MATAEQRREEPRVDQTNTPTAIGYLVALRERAQDQAEAADRAAFEAGQEGERLWLQESSRDQCRLATDFLLVILRQVPTTISDVELLLHAAFDITDAIDPDKPHLNKREARALALAIENCLAFMGDTTLGQQSSEQLAYSHELAKTRMMRRSLRRLVRRENKL